jgi:hypothetical protein
LSSVEAIEDYLAGADGDSVYLPVSLNLADPVWKDLLGAIDFADKNVTLDLSACTMAGTEFDPGLYDSPDWDTPGKNAGKDRIVSLVLPDAATSIIASSAGHNPFDRFYNLKEVAGVNVETLNQDALAYIYTLERVDFPAAATIGRDAFSYCEALETVKLPAAVTIGTWAFLFCEALKTVDLSSAANIGNQAFESTGSESLTVILGNTAPSLGENMFQYASGKTVTVTVPAGATAWNGKTGTFTGSDTAPNWGNGFRGGGWNGAMAGGAVNDGVTLRVEYR